MSRGTKCNRLFILLLYIFLNYISVDIILKVLNICYFVMHCFCCFEILDTVTKLDTVDQTYQVQLYHYTEIKTI